MQSSPCNQSEATGCGPNSDISFLSTSLGEEVQIGQPRLRRNLDSLFVAVGRELHVIIILFLRGNVAHARTQIDGIDSPVESLLAETLDELDLQLTSAGIKDVIVEAFVLLPDIERENGLANLTELLPLEQTFFSGDFGDSIAAHAQTLDQLPEEVFQKVEQLLFPKREWKKVTLVKDENRLSRIEQRAELDSSQLHAAFGHPVGTLFVEGGPGTGKSLVLVSRALWLARNSVHKNILLLSWNKSLTFALKAWTSRLDSVTDPVGPKLKISTIQELFQEFDINVNLADPGDADARCRDILKQTRLSPRFDAVLIDEAQDVGGEMAKLIQEMVVQDGSLTMAFDNNQNVRKRPTLNPNDYRHPLSQITLDQPYRSTPPIVYFSKELAEFADEIAEDIAMMPSEFACEKVQLVWAETIAESLLMVRHEAARLMREIGITPDEILIISFSTTVRRAMVKILSESNESGIDELTEAAQDLQQLAVVSPEVAKGREASCVFVLGWDNGLEDRSSNATIRRYVAATRASDLLYMNYSNSLTTELTDRVAEFVIDRVWPDDYIQEKIEN